MLRKNTDLECLMLRKIMGGGEDIRSGRDDRQSKYWSEGNEMRQTLNSLFAKLQS